jgi:hypothetical protein
MSFVIFKLEAGQPAHNNRCGPLTDNVGHPCLRFDVQAEERKDRLISMTSISHFLTRIRIACMRNGSWENSTSRFRSKCCGSIRATICMLRETRKLISRHYIYF